MKCLLKADAISFLSVTCFFQIQPWQLKWFWMFYQEPYLWFSTFLRGCFGFPRFSENSNPLQPCACQMLHDSEVFCILAIMLYLLLPIFLLDRTSSGVPLWMGLSTEHTRFVPSVFLEERVHLATIQIFRGKLLSSDLDQKTAQKTRLQSLRNLGRIFRKR